MSLKLQPIGAVPALTAIEGNWEKVCILGPYITEPIATDIIGLKSDVMSRSNVFGDDTISLLVTIQGQSIIGLYEVPRGYADFTKVSAGCFNRQSAKFKVVPGVNNWPAVQGV